MSMGYSRTNLRLAKRPAADARGPVSGALHLEQAFSALARARLRIMLAERAQPGCTDVAMVHVLLAMDYLKPGAGARLMPLAEDER